MDSLNAKSVKKKPAHVQEEELEDLEEMEDALADCLDEEMEAYEVLEEEIAAELDEAPALPSDEFIDLGTILLFDFIIIIIIII
jgi:hypothetical protein